jgi:hypothetical protein
VYQRLQKTFEPREEVARNDAGGSRTKCKSLFFECLDANDSPQITLRVLYDGDGVFKDEAIPTGTT